MRQFIVSHLRRFAALAAVFILSVVAFVFAGSTDDKAVAVDADQYNDLMAHRVGDLYDLEGFFVSHQYDFLPIAPPFPDFILASRECPMCFRSTRRISPNPSRRTS